MGRAKYKNGCKRLMCKMVLFGAMERAYMKPGQLSLGHGRCVSPASVTCACCKEVPFTALLCLKLKLGRLSLSVDALKDTAFPQLTEEEI